MLPDYLRRATKDIIRDKFFFVFLDSLFFHLNDFSLCVPVINHTKAKIIQMNVLYFYLALLEHVYTLASDYEMVSVTPFLLSAPRPRSTGETFPPGLMISREQHPSL